MPKDPSPIQPPTARHDLVAFLNAIGNVAADRINPAFKSKYASLAEILDQVKAVARVHNMAVHQSLSSSEGQVRVSTVFLHNDGTTVEAGSLAFKCDGLNAQQLASAISYLRRLCLKTAVGIETDLEDDGAGASRPNGVAKVAAPAAKWTVFLESDALGVYNATEYCRAKGWLSGDQGLLDLDDEKVRLITSNKPAFMKAIAK